MGYATCAGLSPITWSPQDTDETIIQIKQHNAAWRSLCEGVKK